MQYIATVKKISFFLVTIAILVSSCGVAKKNFNPETKYSPQDLQNDFALLSKILQANHPSLYWYTPKDSVDLYFRQTQSSLTDSLTGQQFKNKVAWALTKLHCGHTSTRSSKEIVAYYNHRLLSTFPLQLKVWADFAVVVNNLQKEDSVLTRGTLITAINGVPANQIVDSICQLIGTDGYSNNFKYQLISFNFPGYYRNSFGLDSSYVITYLDSLGNTQQTAIKNFEPKKDSTKEKIKRSGNLPSRHEFRKMRLAANRSLRIDTPMSMAYLAVNTFSEGKLIKFFRKSFRTIRKQQIKNVVVDLRLNSGGSVLASTRLTQYLANKPFHIADTVAAFNRNFQYKKYIHPWLVYWLSMHLSGRRYADGRVHFKYFENHYFKPKTRNHFDGNVYVLTGGYTFSAAALVANNIKGQNNVTIVGEETGGGAYGNSAMHLTTIILPATGVRVTLPLYRLVLNARHPKDGRGVLPDVLVRPTIADIKMNVDSKLDKVLQLIKDNNNIRPIAGH